MAGYSRFGYLTRFLNAAMGGPTERSAIFGHPTHHIGEVDHRASLGPTHVDHRRKRFFDLNSGSGVQDEERRMRRSIYIRSQQLDL